MLKMAEPETVKFVLLITGEGMAFAVEFACLLN